MRNVCLKLFRGKYNDKLILEEGEPYYCTDTKHLFIGDGKSLLTELKPSCTINNIISSKNGKLYSIEVDEEENVNLTPLIAQTHHPNAQTSYEIFIK